MYILNLYSLKEFGKSSRILNSIPLLRDENIPHCNIKIEACDLSNRFKLKHYINVARSYILFIYTLDKFALI